MTVSSNITLADCAAFGRFVHRRISKDNENAKWLLLAGISATVALFYAVFFRTTFHFPSFALGVAATIAWIGLGLRLHAKKMTPAEDGYVLGAQQTTIGDEGLRQKSNQHEALFLWSAIRGVEVTDQHAFVFLDRVAAIILPRGAFASNAEMEEFVAEVKRRSGLNSI